MSDIPEDLRYTKSHEWVRIDGDEAVIGITDHAQELLGDLVFVELPEVGRTLQASEEFGVVESVKAASDVYAPLSGDVVAVNEALNDAPETINNDPYGDGWMVRIRMASPDDANGLLDPARYRDIAAED